MTTDELIEVIEMFKTCENATCFQGRDINALKRRISAIHGMAHNLIETIQKEGISEK